jgi:hypothetical protein
MTAQLQERIAELKTEIAMLMDERDKAETALKSSNDLLIGVRLLFIVNSVNVSKTVIYNINLQIDANNKLLKLTENTATPE